MSPDEFEIFIRPYIRFPKGSRVQTEGTIGCAKVDQVNYDYLLSLCDRWNISFGVLVDAISLALQAGSNDAIPNLKIKQKVQFDVSWTGEQKSKFFKSLTDEEYKIFGSDLESTYSFYNKEFANR